MTTKKSQHDLPLTSLVSEWAKENEIEDEIEINDDQTGSTLRTILDIKDQGCTLYLESNEEDKTIFIYLYADFAIVRENSITAAALLVNEINAELPVGRLIAVVDKAYQFGYALDASSAPPSMEALNSVVGIANSVFENHFEELVKASDGLVSLPKIEDLDDAYPWDEIGGHEKILGWAKSLKHACHNPTSKEVWELIGSAAIMINGDPEYCLKIIKSIAKEAEINYVTFKNTDVIDMPSIHQLQELAPVIVYLEPGRWVVDGKDIDNETNEIAQSYEEFQEKLVSWLNSFTPESPVVLVTSIYDLDDIKDDLKQKGCFDLYMSLQDRSLELVGRDFIRQLGDEICGPSLISSQGKVGHFVNSFDTDKRDLTILALRRLHREESRKIEYIDLVDTEIHQLVEEGLIQEEVPEVRRNTAFHEAGHALTAVLESNGHNIPDYTSILPGASGFAGITVESHGFLMQQKDSGTYKDFRSDIRVALAGRAAEEILGGPLDTTYGCSSDLLDATKHCFKAFSTWGFAPSMEKEGQSESNLSIIFGTRTQSECAHLESLTRSFLEKEYQHVRDQLNHNKELLTKIADRLLEDPIVDQDELAEICAKFDIQVVKH